MSDDAVGLTAASHRRRHAAHVAHAVYGALVATVLLVAADDGLDAGELFWALVTSGVALWTAHAFAAAVGRAVAEGRHLDAGAIVDCLHDELALLIGFAVPLPAIALGVFDLLGDARAADVAIGVLLVALLVVGTMLGRAADMSWVRATAVGLVYPALGAVVVVLEIAVKH